MNLSNEYLEGVIGRLRKQADNMLGPYADTDTEAVVFLEELFAWREGGVTEEVLRRGDGCLKLGKGCSITLDSDFPKGGVSETERLRDIIRRARTAFCEDGPDGKAAANMFEILCEATQPEPVAEPKRTRYVFQIETTRWDDDDHTKGHKEWSMVTAESMRVVVDSIAADFMDRRSTVQSIVNHGPIVSEL